MNQALQPITTVTAFDEATTPRQGRIAVGQDVDLAFFQLFQQLGQQVASQQATVVLPSSQPAERLDESSSPTPTDNDTSPATSVAKPTASQEDESAPLSLDKPLSKADGEFLEWLVAQPQAIPVNSLPNGFQLPTWLANPTTPQSGGGGSGFSGQLSEQLSSLVKAAAKHGRAIRVPLQNQTDVIIKIRNGQVSAEFLTPDATVALQQTVAELRQHLASKALPVDTIAVRQRHTDDPENGGQQQSSSTDDQSSGD